MWVSARGLLSEVGDKQLQSMRMLPGVYLHWYHIQEDLCPVLLRYLIVSGLQSGNYSAMAGVTRKGSGRPSYYYRFLGKSRLQRQRSRSRSRTRPSASRGNKYHYYCLKSSPCCSFSLVYSTRCKCSNFVPATYCIFVVAWLLLDMSATFCGSSTRWGSSPFQTFFCFTCSCENYCYSNIIFRTHGNTPLLRMCLCSWETEWDDSLASLFTRWCYSRVAPPTPDSSQLSVNLPSSSLGTLPANIFVPSN